MKFYICKCSYCIIKTWSLFLLLCFILISCGADDYNNFKLTIGNPEYTPRHTGTERNSETGDLKFIFLPQSVEYTYTEVDVITFPIHSISGHGQNTQIYSELVPGKIDFTIKRWQRRKIYGSVGISSYSYPSGNFYFGSWSAPAVFPSRLFTASRYSINQQTKQAIIKAGEVTTYIVYL